MPLNVTECTNIVFRNLSLVYQPSESLYFKLKKTSSQEVIYTSECIGFTTNPNWSPIDWTFSQEISLSFQHQITVLLYDKDTILYQTQVDFNTLIECPHLDLVECTSLPYNTLLLETSMGFYYTPLRIFKELYPKNEIISEKKEEKKIPYDVRLATTMSQELMTVCESNMEMKETLEDLKNTIQKTLEEKTYDNELWIQRCENECIREKIIEKRRQLAEWKPKEDEDDDDDVEHLLQVTGAMEEQYQKNVNEVSVIAARRFEKNTALFITEC